MLRTETTDVASAPLTAAQTRVPVSDKQVTAVASMRSVMGSAR